MIDCVPLSSCLMCTRMPRAWWNVHGGRGFVQDCLLKTCYEAREVGRRFLEKVAIALFLSLRRTGVLYFSLTFDGNVFDGTISCVLSRTTKSLHGWQTLRTGGASKRAKKGGRVPRRYTTASFSRSLCSRRGVLIHTCTLVYTLYSTRIYLVFVPRFVSCVGRGINNKNCRLQRVVFFFGISLMADVPQRTII